MVVIPFDRYRNKTSSTERLDSGLGICACISAIPGIRNLPVPSIMVDFDPGLTSVEGATLKIVSSLITTDWPVKTWSVFMGITLTFSKIISSTSSAGGWFSQPEIRRRNELINNKRFGLMAFFF